MCVVCVCVMCVCVVCVVCVCVSVCVCEGGLKQSEAAKVLRFNTVSVGGVCWLWSAVGGRCGHLRETEQYKSNQNLQL